MQFIPALARDQNAKERCKKATSKRNRLQKEGEVSWTGPKLHDDEAAVLG